MSKIRQQKSRLVRPTSLFFQTRAGDSGWSETLYNQRHNSKADMQLCQNPLYLFILLRVGLIIVLLLVPLRRHERFQVLAGLRVVLCSVLWQE